MPSKKRRESTVASSITVVARFRPINKNEEINGAENIAEFGAQHVTVLDKKKKSFNFDRVIPPNSTQEEVFKCTGAPLVDQVLCGYHSTCFAYGQTGSGKTWTMQGNESHPGIIPRMVDSLFDRFLYDPEFENTQFTVQIQYIEIYKEKIQDLLNINNRDLKVRQHKNKGVFVQNCSNVFASSPEEVQMFFEQGQSNRAVGCTNMNAHSSRSHSVFMLLVEQKNMETQSSKKSKLMLVDLAGSEKVRKTNAKGNTLAEAQSINLSLSELGNVINALTEGRGHVPYRNSKLTWILSDSLGGNSKTCIIVTASPAKYNIEETISTMSFGVRCKKVKNKPKVNQELSILEYKKKLGEMERKLATQNAQIVALEQALRTGSTSLRKGHRQVFSSPDVFQDGGLEVDDMAIKSDDSAPKVDTRAALQEAEALVIREEELEEKVQTLQDERDDLLDKLRELETQLKENRLNDEKVLELEEKLRESEEKNKMTNLYKNRLDNLEAAHQAEISELKQRAHDAEKLILEGGEIGLPGDVTSPRPDEFAPSEDDLLPFPRFDSLARNCVQLFLRYDTNRNRVLEKNEIEAMLKSLGIRPREVIIDKVCLAFGMDSWQIPFDAFMKTLPKAANEKTLYEFLVKLIPKNEDQEKKKLMKGELIDQYNSPELLSKEDLIHGVTQLVEHHKTMMSKLMKAYEQNHLFINQLRQFGKQEETHEEWRAKLREENRELTEMLADLNETLATERKEYTKKIDEAQKEMQEVRKKAANNAMLLRPGSTAPRNRIIKPFQRPVSVSSRVNMPYKVVSPHSPQQALDQFRQKFRRKSKPKYSNSTPNLTLNRAKSEPYSTRSPKSSLTDSGDLRNGISSISPAQFSPPSSPIGTQDTYEDPPDGSSTMSVDSPGKDTSIISTDNTSAVLKKSNSPQSSVTFDLNEEILIEEMKEESEDVGEEDVEPMKKVELQELKVEIATDASGDLSDHDASSAYE